MKVHVLERKQYGGYRGVVYPDVVETTQSKDGSRTMLHFADGGKVTKLTRLIKQIEGKE